MGSLRPGEPQGWDMKPAGVWCLQLNDWKQDPVKMGAAGGGTRLAGPWLVWGVGAVLAVWDTGLGEGSSLV